MHFPSGTCHLIRDPDACGSSWAGHTVDGDCISAGYTHECMGHYGIGVWFKTDDCGGCKSEEGMGKDGQPCPKKQDTMISSVHNATQGVSAPCHRIDGPVTDSPIMHFPS